MSLLVKALRQLDARQRPSAHAVEVVAEAAVVEVVAAEAAIETRGPVAERFGSEESYYPDPLAVLAVIEATTAEENLPAETALELEVDESLFGFDSASENDPQLGLREHAAAQPEQSQPEPSPIQNIAELPAREPGNSISNFELAANYPTLAETISSIAAEEIPAITMPTTESLLTEIGLTEATVVPVPSERVEKQIETALDRLDELRALISASDIWPDLVAQDAPQLLPISSTPTRAFHIREEFRELRDHLLARYTLPRGAAVMFIDSGRQTSDTSWLFPLAASLLQHFADSPNPDFKGRPPRILLVEAAGPACGLANSLGLEAVAGLSDILQSGKSWNSAVLSTWHPQISMLAGGTEPLVCGQDCLPALFQELAENFDVLLLAAGPWIAGAHVPANLSEEARPIRSTASLLAGCASATVLCVELDGTPLLVAEAVKRNLAASDMNLLGCVVRGDITAA